MRRRAFIAFLPFGMLASQPNPQEIIQRSVETNQTNWMEAERRYSFTECDVKSKSDSVETVRTYDVLMVEDSPYRRPIAENNRPLSSKRQAEETQKFQREIYKRRHETKEERGRRIAKSSKELDQDHALLREMADALDYRVAGEEVLDGHDVWLLEATSKVGYKPRTREAKILTGMTGKLWIEKGTYQWVKAEAEVIKPVSFLGFIARVGPGTRFILEQAPVQGNLWLPKHFRMEVNATILGIIHREYGEDHTYSNYRIEVFP